MLLVRGGGWGDARGVRPATLTKSLLTPAIFAIVLACNPISDLPRGESERGPISDWPNREGHTVGPASDEDAEDSSEPEAVVPPVDNASAQDAPGRGMAATSAPPNPSGAESLLDAGVPPFTSAEGFTQPDADTADASEDSGEDAGAADASIEAGL